MPFNALTPDLMGMIVDKCIAEMGKGLADKKVNLTLTPEARSWLAKEGYDAKLGARPLQRLLREALEDPLAGEVLFWPIGQGWSGHCGRARGWRRQAGLEVLRKSRGVEDLGKGGKP